ncbi:MAG: MaoC family dehydratase N-terminal domain-containing protein [Acidimicrobiales bacterium]
MTGAACGPGADADRLPEDIDSLIGVRQYAERADFPVERGYIWTSCASVENGNPLFWDDDVADALTGGPIAPPSTISLWLRPHYWSPGHAGERLALQVHFDLKARLGLPEAIMSDNSIVFYDPVRPGDVIASAQILRSVSPPKVTKLGAGRFWVIDIEYTNQWDELVALESYTGFGYRRGAATDDAVAGAPTDKAVAVTPSTAGPTAAASSAAGPSAGVALSAPAAGPDGLTLDAVHIGDSLPALARQVDATTVVLGALATRDWRPMHHDHRFAVERQGVRDIFLNTPNQAAWFERYLTDWSGPRGRLGRVRFRMHDSVFSGDAMTLRGTVTTVDRDETGCGWVDVDLTMSVGDRMCTTCRARLALPTTPDDNPWARRGERWQP